MRFGFLFSGVFWGSLLIFLGLSLIARVIFHINIPVFRIAFALVLIYLGVQLLFCGGKWCGLAPRSVSGPDVVFSEGEMKYDVSRGEYNVVFGKGRLDISAMSASDVAKETVVKEANAVFGNLRLKINPAVPTRIKAGAVFGAVSLPDGNSVAFSERFYATPSYKEGSPHLYLKASAVFGSVEVDDKK